MRTYIRHESGGYIDAATITEITSSGDLGGIVGIKSAASSATAHGHIVARQMPEETAHLFTEAGSPSTEAWAKQAAVIAESLLHAICRAEAIAKVESNGAVIRYNEESTRWTITNLGNTASSPTIT